MARKPPFTVALTDEERERLEAHRVALGARSLADVVRHWIAQPDVAPGAFGRFAGKSHESSGRTRSDLAETTKAHADWYVETVIGRPKAAPGSLLKKR